MKKKKILVVDDEAAFTRLLKLNLEKTGHYEVREVNRAPAALSAARELKPDLILLDVVMPAMDGGDVAALIRQDKSLKDTAVLYLTATVAKREVRHEPLASGGSLFLAKPISLEELVHHINQQLQMPAGQRPEARP